MMILMKDWSKKNNVINEIVLILEVCMMKVEKILVMIREWKIIEIKGSKNGVFV